MTERGRIAILHDLIALSAPVSELSKELTSFPWDSEELVTLTRDDVVVVLGRCLDGQVSPAEVSAWARALEGRDDVALEPSARDELSQFLFEVGHSEINAPLTPGTVRAWRDRLRLRRPQRGGGWGYPERRGTRGSRVRAMDSRSQRIVTFLQIAWLLPYAPFFVVVALARVAIWPLLIFTGLDILLYGIAVLRDYGMAGTRAADTHAKVQRWVPFARPFDQRARRTYTLFFGSFSVVFGIVMAFFGLLFWLVGLQPE